MLPTDTQKNTAFAYAKLHGVSSIEDYALALGRRLLEATPAASAAQVRVEEYAWDRLGQHAFVRRGGDVRTCVVTVGRDETHVLVRAAGPRRAQVHRLGVQGVPQGRVHDPGRDRRPDPGHLARSRRGGTPAPTSTGTRRTTTCASCLLSTFATTYSRALQETLYAHGHARSSRASRSIAEIRFSAPNKHHFLVDFCGFDVDGLTNDGEVFIAADRPYGLIEAQVTRDDAPPAGDAWLHVPGFC